MEEIEDRGHERETHRLLAFREVLENPEGFRMLTLKVSYISSGIPSPGKSTMAAKGAQMT